MARIRAITGPTWSARPPLADAARVAGFALALLATEALLARGVAGPEVARYVFLFLGLFALAFVFRFPMATALIFFGLTDFIFPTTYFAHSVGSLTVKPHELALACLFFLAVVQPKRRTWGGTAGIALAAFLALVAVSAALGVTSGRMSITEAFNWGRPLGLLAFFYVVIRLFPTPEERRMLLNGAAVLAALTGIVAVAIALGTSIGASLEPANSNTVTDEGFGSIQRVRLAGLSAGYLLFWYAVVQTAVSRGWRRLSFFLIVGGIGLDIAVSFNRNMWMGIVLGALLMAVFGGTAVRHRLAVGCAVVLAGVAMLMVFGSSSTNSQIVKPIVKRGATILDPGKTTHESSLEDRARETSTAWAVAQRHLLLGVGTGATFGVFVNEPIDTGSFIIGVKTVPQFFLHNQYLYLILIAGIPGAIAFLVFLGTGVAQAIRRVPRDPAITALGVGLVMVMISSVVAIYFTVDDMTAMLGLLVGVIVADSEGRAVRGESSGLVV